MRTNRMLFISAGALALVPMLLVSPPPPARAGSCGTWQFVTDEVASAPPDATHTGVAVDATGGVAVGYRSDFSPAAIRRVGPTWVPDDARSTVAATQWVARDEVGDPVPEPDPSADSVVLHGVASVGGRTLAAADGPAVVELPPFGAPVATQVALSGHDAGSFNDLSFSSPTDGWAVGYRQGPADDAPVRPLLAHFDGKSWREMKAPSLRFPEYSLESVWTASPKSAVAVGRILDADYQLRPLVLRWDGKAWAVASLPAAVARMHVELSSVRGASPDDIWAVGRQEDAKGAHAFSMHWDGKTWARRTVPDAGVVAAGVDSPPRGPLLMSVVPVDGGALAIGMYEVDAGGEGASRPYVLAFENGKWVPLDVPAPFGTAAGEWTADLWAAAAVSRSEVFAVGSQRLMTDPFSKPWVVHAVCA